MWCSKPSGLAESLPIGAHREDATAAALWTRRMRGAGEQPDAGAPSSAPTSTEW